MEQIKDINANIQKLQTQLDELELKKQIILKENTPDKRFNENLVIIDKFTNSFYSLCDYNGFRNTFGNVINVIKNSFDILNEKINELKSGDINRINADVPIAAEISNAIQIKIPQMHELSQLNQVIKSKQYFNYEWKYEFNPKREIGSSFMIFVTSTRQLNKEIYISKFDFVLLLLKITQNRNNDATQNDVQLLDIWNKIYGEYRDIIDMRNIYSKNISRCVLEFISEKFNINKNNVRKSRSHIILDYVYPLGQYKPNYDELQYAYIDTNLDDNSQIIIFSINFGTQSIISHFIINHK